MFGWDGTITFHLTLPEGVKGLLKVRRFSRNFLSSIVEVELTCYNLLHICIRCKPDERIAGTYIKINVWQGLDTKIASRWFRIYLGSELEEEAKLTNFHRLLHNVYPEEIIEDNRF